MAYSYLALGDSYTIGEGVPVYDSFPYQVVQLLRKAGHLFYAPEIIAKTGWTTDELSAGIANTVFLERYDIVSLLIGVNNQYRGRSVDEYAGEFEGLLKQAIVFAGGDASRVIVLSIPDWGVSPFAPGTGKDLEQVEREIDAYNAVNDRISAAFQVHYINITSGTRASAGDETMFADDKLHPSGKEYAHWAARIVDRIIPRIKE